MCFPSPDNTPGHRFFAMMVGIRDETSIRRAPGGHWNETSAQVRPWPCRKSGGCEEEGRLDR
eukprot:2753417-Pyramimonas_sp.AAC.1